MYIHTTPHHTSPHHTLLKKTECTTYYLMACRSIPSLILLLLLSQTSRISAGTDHDSYSENRVILSLYYESLCPYCADFMVNHLVRIFQTDLVDIVNLRLIPWGNTRIQNNETWICQHGVDECQLDVAEACAIHAWPAVKAHFKFIHCVERLHLMGKHTEWRSCFGSTHLDSKLLDDCYSNGLGYQLEKAYADETAKLNPQHRFVPWLVVDHFPLQEDYQNFISYICKAYKGSKTPEACKSRSFEIDASKIATSVSQVCPRATTKDNKI